MEDHFLALQTYGYHDNAVPSEVLLTTFCSFLYLFEVIFNLVNGTGTFFMAAVLFILQKCVEVSVLLPENLPAHLQLSV